MKDTLLPKYALRAAAGSSYSQEQLDTFLYQATPETVKLYGRLRRQARRFNKLAAILRYAESEMKDFERLCLRSCDNLVTTKGFDFNSFVRALTCERSLRAILY